jgi:hypothetical protein
MLFVGGGQAGCRLLHLLFLCFHGKAARFCRAVVFWEMVPACVTGHRLCPLVRRFQGSDTCSKLGTDHLNLDLAGCHCLRRDGIVSLYEVPIVITSTCSTTVTRAAWAHSLTSTLLIPPQNHQLPALSSDDLYQPSVNKSSRLNGSPGFKVLPPSSHSNSLGAKPTTTIHS